MPAYRKLIWCASAVLVATVLSVSSAWAGAFAGQSMYLDTSVGEDPAVNDSVTTMRTPVG
jgi:hypothetical protein